MTDKKMCSSDKDRVCGPDCIAYNPDGFSIVRVPRFDRSLPIPQWTWSGTEAYRAIVCKKEGFTIEVLEKVDKPEDTHGEQRG